MTDNKRKKKADGKRVALKQDYERDYLVKQLTELAGRLANATAYAQLAMQHGEAGMRELFPVLERLRAGAGSSSRANRAARKAGKNG